MKNKPLVSVIVPTKNSKATIENCLKSIKGQSYTNIEIIVVDNHSSDNTRKIAEKYGKVYVKGEERAAQVNFGVEMAKGKYIYEVGSDFILEPAVIEEAVEKCEKEGYDAIAVHNTSDPTISFWSKVRKMERDCYKDDELNIAARFFRRYAFEAIGGFDENLVAAEDYDFHERLLKQGFKIGRINAQEIHIGEPRSLLEIAKKHYYYGKNIGKYVKKNPKRAVEQFAPARRSYFRNRRSFLNYPTLTIGFIVYQFVRYAATGMGLICAKLRAVS